MDTILSHLVERLNHLRTQEDFETFLRGAAEEMGFDMFAYAGGRLAADRAAARTVFQRPPITMSSFPSDWLTHYAEEGYFKDDYVVVQSLRAILPDQWHAERGVREIRPRQAQIMREAIDAGLRRGFFVPIHGPANDFGLLNVICHEAETEFSKIVERYKHELHILAFHFHDAVQKRLPASASRGVRVQLTERESEILRWTAVGKTSWEISEILHITERTVNFHVANSMRKLGVYSRTHAVAKSISLGLTQL